MNQITNSTGKRQFFIAAGVSPATAMAYNKISGAVHPSFQTGSSQLINAARLSSDDLHVARNGDSSSHLLSPLKIGGVTLKNRLFSTDSYENFPTAPSRFYSVYLAANGVGIVTPRMIWGREKRKMVGNGADMVVYDLESSGAQKHLYQVVEQIHGYGAKAAVELSLFFLDCEKVSPGPNLTTEPLSENISSQLIDTAVRQLKRFKELGYDMATLQLLQYTCESNQREAFSVALCRALKEALGPDFLIAAKVAMSTSPLVHSLNPWTYTMKEIIRSARQWQGLVDILLLGTEPFRHSALRWKREKPPSALRFSHSIKKKGIKIFVAPHGGFGDPVLNESYIRDQMADIIGMARQLVSDWEYVKKVAAGRNEDVVPCIRCNKCNGWKNPPWVSVCSVNPKVGLDSSVQFLPTLSSIKRVAVIGGGPAGMKAAITAAERGHRVTLYEKLGSLGGLLKHSDYSSIKWPLKDFKDYLVRQVSKSRIDVYLNTAATRKIIEKEGYDAIILAIGAEPAMIEIHGCDGPNVHSIDSVYGREKTLGRHVAVAVDNEPAEYGVETALHLARIGHKVTLFTAEKNWMNTIGNKHLEYLVATFTSMKNCHLLMGTRLLTIKEDKVTVLGVTGRRSSIPADSVVLYNGLKSCRKESLKFAGSADQIHLVGNCTGDVSGGVQATQRNAFFTASRI